MHVDSNLSPALRDCVRTNDCLALSTHLILPEERKKKKKERKTLYLRRCARAENSSAVADQLLGNHLISVMICTAGLMQGGHRAGLHCVRVCVCIVHIYKYICIPCIVASIEACIALKE